MSLIEKAAAASGATHGRSLHTKQPEQTARMIQQSGELSRLIDRVVQANMPDHEKTAKMKEDGCRTAVVSCNWPLVNIQSKVNQGIWATMVGRALEGLIGSVEHLSRTACTDRCRGGQTDPVIERGSVTRIEPIGPSIPSGTAA